MKKTARLHRNVWATSGTSFLTDVSSEMILNVLPLFLSNVLGVRVWAVGAVEGIADTTAAFVKLYSGWISDRFRARKTPAVLGYAVSAAAKPFYLIAGSWIGVAAIRWGDRVGKGIRTGPRDALLADSTDASRRGLVFGLHRAADSAGAVIGLLVTVAVVQGMQGGAVMLEWETFRKLVLWSLVPAALGVVVLALGAEDVSPGGTRTAVSADASTDAPRLRLRGLGRGFAVFIAASVVFELGNSADAFLVLRAQERGLSVLELLWVLVGFNVVYTLLALPAGALSDRWGRKRVLAAGWLVYAACYAGFALAETSGHIVLLYLVYGAYHALVAGAAKALVADLVPAELRGVAYGGYAAAVGVVTLPASLIGGVLWQGFGPWDGLGPSAPFAFGAVTAVAGVGLLGRVGSGQRV